MHCKNYDFSYFESNFNIIQKLPFINTPLQQVGFSVDEEIFYYPCTYADLHPSTLLQRAHWISSQTFQLTLIPVKTTLHLKLTKSAPKI